MVSVPAFRPVDLEYIPVSQKGRPAHTSTGLLTFLPGGKYPTRPTFSSCFPDCSFPFVPPTRMASDPTESEKPPVKRNPEEVAREVLESRSVRVFRPSKQRFDPRQIELPDDFFEPSAEELAVAARAMTSGIQRMADAPLMTKKMRDAEQAKRMSRFRKVFIRLLLPDRVALQGIFEPQTSLRQVQRFLRAALRDARNVRFHLFVVPPKMKLTDMDVTLWSQGFVPAALIHVAIDEGPTDSQSLLKDFLLEKIEDTPEYVQPVPVAPPTEEKPQQVENPAESPKKKFGKKIPKWFKTK